MFNFGKTLAALIVLAMVCAKLDARPQVLEVPQVVNDLVIESFRLQAEEWNAFKNDELNTLETSDFINLFGVLVSGGVFYYDAIKPQNEEEERVVRQHLTELSKLVTDTINGELENTVEGSAFIDQFGGFVKINLDFRNNRIRSISTPNWSFVFGSDLEFIRAIQLQKDGSPTIFTVQTLGER